jgi:hypothetical protein
LQIETSPEFLQVEITDHRYEGHVLVRDVFSIDLFYALHNVIGLFRVFKLGSQKFFFFLSKSKRKNKLC